MTASFRSVFLKSWKIKGIAESQRVCDFSDWQIRGCEKLGSRIGFFLLNELSGGNAHLLLEKLGEVADMITGGLSHFRDGDLFGEMILHIENGIGQRRIKILSSQRNGFRRAALRSMKKTAIRMIFISPAFPASFPTMHRSIRRSRIR